LIKSNFVQNIFKKAKYFPWATPEIRQNPHLKTHKKYPKGEKQPKIIPISGEFDQFCLADSGGFLHQIWLI
jgi:hypothetical protein